MGYQPLPPKRPRRNKAQPKGEHPADYYADGHRPRAATFQDLLPTSEHTGRPYDPKLISGLSRKEQQQVERWFLGLPDGPSGQSNSATLTLMARVERSSDVIEASYGTRYLLTETLDRPRNPRPGSIVRRHGGYSPRVQPNPEEVFPLKYRSPVTSEQAALLNSRLPNPKSGV